MARSGTLFIEQASGQPMIRPGEASLRASRRALRPAVGTFTQVSRARPTILPRMSAAPLLSAHGRGPWDAITYSSNPLGIAEISKTVTAFSLVGVNPVSGRAVVVHDSSGARVGCGLIKPFLGELVDVATYPGVTNTIKGLLGVSTSPTTGALSFTGTLTGLQASSTGGWHVHSGYSCSTSTANAAADSYGPPHYGDSLDPLAPPTVDPWSTTQYTADTSGAAQISYTIADFSLWEGSWPVIGHAIVVHAQGGPRAACGIIGTPQMGLVTMGVYPDAAVTDPGPKGTLRVMYDKLSDKLHIDGIVSGLDAGSVGGWHVHSGFQCSADNSITGGHYPTTGDYPDDAWKPFWRTRPIAMASPM